MTPNPSQTPWRSKELAAWLAANVTGLGVLTTAFAHIASRTDVSHQIPDTNLAVIGLLIGGVADVGILFTAWRRLTQRTVRFRQDTQRWCAPSANRDRPA